MSVSGAAPDNGDLQARSRLRELMLVKCFYKIREGWTPEQISQCDLNQQLLRMVSESYFKDLDRKKEFHEITFADEHKRAGYMAKWIMRYRPIQLKSEDADALVLLANEHFALLIALAFIKVRPSAVPPNLYHNLIYCLRFRQFDANAWALSFYLLQQAYGSK